MFSHQLQSETNINTSPDRVWEVLMDFAAYPEWNPFIRSIRGVPRKGESLEVFIQTGGAGGMTFRPHVLVAEPGRELRWRGRLLLPGLFDGTHSFEIRPVADGKVVFRQSESFSGLLVPFLTSRLDRDTRKGFEEMNRALKARAEAADAPDGVSEEAHHLDHIPKV
ncbi:MAG TPA: SRPBCC domain-containing protein [Syntrophales bacterium]|nr:SRPBCC domain-containing protein [Syntrophales bacterium]